MSWKRPERKTPRARPRLQPTTATPTTWPRCSGAGATSAGALWVTRRSGGNTARERSPKSPAFPARRPTGMATVYLTSRTTAHAYSTHRSMGRVCKTISTGTASGTHATQLLVTEPVDETRVAPTSRAVHSSSVAGGATAETQSQATLRNVYGSSMSYAPSLFRASKRSASGFILPEKLSGA